MKDYTITPKDIIRKEVDGTHYYYVHDEWYPGVTTILDEAAPKEYGLLNFFKNNSPEDIERIKNETGAFGSMIHATLEKLLYGVEIELKDYPENAKRIIFQFTDWFKTVRPIRYMPEHTVAVRFNDSTRYAGTLDLFGEFSTEGLIKVGAIKPTDPLAKKEYALGIVDFKTTSGIYFSHKLQVRAYQKAVEEMYHKKIDFVAIARFGTRHKCGYEMKMVDDCVTFKNFMAVMNNYKSLHDGKLPDPPKVEVYPDTVKLIETDVKEIYEKN